MVVYINTYNQKHDTAYELYFFYRYFKIQFLNLLKCWEISTINIPENLNTILQYFVTF